MERTIDVLLRAQDKFAIALQAVYDARDAIHYLNDGYANAGIPTNSFDYLAMIGQWLRDGKAMNERGILELIGDATGGESDQ